MTVSLAKFVLYKGCLLQRQRSRICSSEKGTFPERGRLPVCKEQVQSQKEIYSALPKFGPGSRITQFEPIKLLLIFDPNIIYSIHKIVFN